MLKLFTIKFCMILSLMISANAYSQSNNSDPLGRVKDLVNSDEIILLNSQTLGSNPDNQNIKSRVFDIDLFQINPDTKLVPKPVQTDSIITGNKRMAVTTGNYLGEQFKHLVAAWAGANNSIKIMIPQINSGSLSWSSVNRYSLNNAMLPFTRSPKTQIRLTSGNYSGDKKEEFVLGYIGADSTVKLKMFTVNNSLVPVLGDSISNEKTVINSSGLDAFDIVSGDFDGDGYQEIGLIFVKKNTSGWTVSVRIYDVSASGNFISKGTANLFSQPAYNITNIQISASAKDFNYDAVDEIAAGYAFTHANTSQPGTYIDMVQIKDSLNTIIANSTRRATLDLSNESESRPFDISAGDLNGDGINDIAVASRGNINAYTVVQSTLIPQLRISGPTVYGWESGAVSYSERIMQAADLDYNRKADIVCVGNPYSVDNDNQFFNIYTYEVNDAFTAFTLKARKENYETVLLNGNMGNLRHFAIALGDFNGDRVRLGAANHFTKRLVKQPLVILNTPPVHFDKFESGSATYDLSGCFPAMNCGFSADYIQATTIDTTLSVEVHKDWGVDASLSGGGNFFGIGVQASIKTSYDEGFGNVQGSGSTIRVTEGRRAQGDDVTFNIVNDYDFYEYPVYDSLNVFRGNVLVVVPGATSKIWVESKDDYVIGNIYRPEHEVGNILSYKDSVSLSEDTAQLIYQFNPQTVGSSGSSFTQLELENFNSSGADTSRKIGVEVGGTLGGWGIEVGVNGRYSQNQISSVTTKVNSSMLLRGDYGRLNPPFNLSQNTYYIIPYAYWAKNGALVYDYKVQINNNPNSFWNQNYGNKTDPALALPWRLDPEKGYPLPGNDSTYRFRSKDVRISKIDPVPGDTVTISARVSNYGLLNITSNVLVRFYKGNPYEGGTPIGESTITGGIQSRRSKYASVNWTVPAATPGNERMFVVIDPNNTITNEVHEFNNRGWAPLSDYSLPVGISSNNETQIPEAMELLQNYPNPFNPSTTITFKIKTNEFVSLKIFDVTGREVQTLVNEKMNAGSYNYNWNASALTSGVYFYRLKAGSFIETKKLMLIK